MTNATLTYVATPVSELVGSIAPSYAGTVTGFLNNDTQASATVGTLAFGTTATAGSPAGTYPINGSGLAAYNYIFVQAPGNAAALTLTNAVPGHDFWNGAGADNNWQTGLNWSVASANVPPIAGDSLVFDGATLIVNNNNYPGGTSFGGLTFNPGAGAFVLGGNSISTSAGVTNNSTSAETINLPMVLAASQNISLTNGGMLAINGAISGAGFGLTLTDLGTLALTGSNCL